MEQIVYTVCLSERYTDIVQEIQVICASQEAAERELAKFKAEDKFESCYYEIIPRIVIS